MVRGMAWRVNGGQRIALALQHIAFPHFNIRRIGQIVACVRAAGGMIHNLRMGRTAAYVCASERLQRARGGRMIAVGVGDENMGDAFALRGGEQGRQMIGVFRTGVDHGHLASAHDIGAGSREGERRGIGRDNAAHEL